jgi:hypothetical protein
MGWRVGNHGRQADEDGSRNGLAVTTLVRVYPGTANEARGVIVEDFGDSAGQAVDIGGRHIVSAARRWAVQLDDGSLVFVDDADLAVN